jgi:hypothetical protein
MYKYLKSKGITMLYFDKIPPNQFSLLGAILGVLLTADMDADEQNSFGNFLVSVGQGLLTSVAQKQNQNAHNIDQQKYDELCSKIDDISNQLVNIKDKLRGKN